MRRCSVLGCDSKNEYRRFYVPVSQRLRNIWLERINNPKLKDRFSFAVCAKHFDPMCIEKSGRIRKFSLPTLHLPDYECKSSKANCFSFPVHEPLYCFNLNWEDSKTSELKECEADKSEIEVKIPTRTYLTPKQKLHERQSDTSLQNTVNNNGNDEISSANENLRSEQSEDSTNVNEKDDTSDVEEISAREVIYMIEDDTVEVVQEVNAQQTKNLNKEFRKELMKQIVNKVNSLDDKKFYKWARMTFNYMNELDNETD